MDVDNLAKPILDALKSVVFEDDGQVTDLLSRKRNLAEESNVPITSPVLSNALSRRGEFVHIIVERVPDQGMIQ
jgi:hypothetical protein